MAPLNQPEVVIVGAGPLLALDRCAPAAAWHRLSHFRDPNADLADGNA
jgi:hypothetical protein